MSPYPSKIPQVVALCASLLLAQGALAQAPTTTASRSLSAPARRMLQLWHEKRAAGARFNGATLAAVRGQVYTEHPELFKRTHLTSPEVRRKQRQKGTFDPTFRGRHPMFRRLVKQGWYKRSGDIAKLQQLADGLRQNRTINRNKPLGDVEFIAFDLEATNGSAGRYSKGKNKFYAGWDEITQFGYTVYRGGKKIDSGTINIRPDVMIDRRVSRLTGLTHKGLRKAPRFEQAAGKILELMQGRVLLGQSADKNDWAWMQSNFHRLGVNLPGPRGMLLDTRKLSFLYMPQGGGLKSMSQRFNVRLDNAHNAQADAQATGDIFWAMMRKSKARTLSHAFALQAKGDDLRHNPRPQPPPATVKGLSPHPASPIAASLH